MRPLALSLAAALAVSAGPAAGAPSITLNGIPIDGATGQRFENCTVVIDDKGNIDIQAKGYAVKGTGGEARTTPATGVTGVGTTASADAGRVTRHYVIVTEHAAPGTQYDLAVFVNAQWIRSVKANEPQAVMDITRFLRPGQNKITFAATKRIVGDRVAYGRDVTLKATVGEGNASGDHVMIAAPLAQMIRTAAEIDDRTEEFVIEAR